MLIVTVICLVVTIVILFRYLLLRQDTQNLKEQLKTINHSHTNQLLMSPHHFKELSGLIQEINQEISKKNLAIEQLEQRERQIKEQFTNISHDLRTPLASILGYLTLLEEEDDSHQQAHYQQLIQQKARQLQQLIDTYYDFSRIESLDLSLVMTTIDLNLLLPQLLVTYYAQFKEQAILPTLSLPITPWLVVADEQALQRIFTNLIQNCLKYGDQTFDIGCHEQQLIMRNHLKDPSKVAIKQVFQRLYTSDSSRHLHSTGLGLTVSKQLLEQMGHNIQASIEDHWFTITITWGEKLTN